MSARLRRLRGVLLAAALLACAADAQAQAGQPQGLVPEAAADTKTSEPFAFADFTWLTGNPRTKDLPLHTKVVTGEFRVDTSFTYSFNHPKDNTIVGSSEVFRSGELQLTQLGIGGDFHVENVRGRLMTQFGMYSQTTPRNDASPARGQWNLDGAYRYVSEAYGGYHWDRLHGINVDAGIFMSYVGLYSYYQFDNWSYQPSYVSSNTPWFFTGLRIQIFPSDRLKIEPWIVNGWQSYGRFNKAPGIGGQAAFSVARRCAERARAVVPARSRPSPQRGAHDVAMVHVQAVLVDRIQPDPVDEIEVFLAQRRRMRADRNVSTSPVILRRRGATAPACSSRSDPMPAPTGAPSRCP